MLRQGCNSDGEVISSVYAEHKPVYSDTEGPSLTRQEFAAECDINNLMAQYDQTGVINHYNRVSPQYLDLTECPVDLQDALDHLQRATTAFMTLPAVVRREFDNDPRKFVEFAQDPENLPQMRTWELAPGLPNDPPPMRVEIVPPPADEAKPA